MEKLSIDFKGPITSVTRNTYLIVVIEYSWFPFVFPCPNMHTTMIIKALDRLFSLTCMPSYIDSNRGAYFIQKVKLCPITQPAMHKLNNLMALFRR